MRANTLKSQTLFGEENSQNLPFFPSTSVVKLLVECGAKINANNQTGIIANILNVSINHKTECVMLH